MTLTVFPTDLQLADFVATEMVELIQSKPGAVICLASGNSPKLSCELFVQKALATDLNTSNFFFVGLDEWVGLGPDTYGSCHYDFETRIFEPLKLASSQYHLFNGLANDLQKECTTMDNVIKEKGGIDLMVVGIGMNGHIGFNEPGSNFNSLSHVAKLEAMTTSIGQQYFNEPMALNKGITLGLAHLMAAKKVLLIANGSAKASVIKKAAEEKPDPSLPATIMQLHPNGFILVDEEAASLLNK
jgi:glucosamine-6-phosphate isomerase